MNDQTPNTQNVVRTQSSRVRTILASLLLVVGLSHESLAPIYGLFPGLSKLLEGADAVVVAEIIERPTQTGWEPGGVYKIYIQKVLKGEAKDAGTYSAYLRSLPFRTTTNHIASLLPGGLKAGARAVFFLKKNDDAELKADFRNENCAGDAFSINPNVDLKELDGFGPRQAVEFLLKDRLAYERARFHDYETAVTDMVASP